MNDMLSENLIVCNLNRVVLLSGSLSRCRVNTVYFVLLSSSEHV
jgi:hypothetical protein